VAPREGVSGGTSRVMTKEVRVQGDKGGGVGEAGEMAIISPAWHDTCSPSGDADFRLTREYTSHSTETAVGGEIRRLLFREDAELRGSYGARRESEREREIER